MNIVNILLAFGLIVLGMIFVIAAGLLVIFALMNIYAALYPKVEPLVEKWIEWYERRTGW